MCVTGVNPRAGVQVVTSSPSLYGGRVDRKDIGSWLSGPRIDPGTDAPSAYPGERLGLPQQGKGSATPWGRRIGALFIDWLIVLGITLAIVGPPQPGDDTFGLASLGVLVVMYVVLLMTARSTIGMWLLGLAVWPVGSQHLSFVRVVLRSVLLALVIPAVVYDRDRRGLHDKAGATIVIRSR